MEYWEPHNYRAAGVDPPDEDGPAVAVAALVVLWVLLALIWLWRRRGR